MYSEQCLTYLFDSSFPKDEKAQQELQESREAYMKDHLYIPFGTRQEDKQRLVKKYEAERALQIEQDVSFIPLAS